MLNLNKHDIMPKRKDMNQQRKSVYILKKEERVKEKILFSVYEW